MGIVETSLTRSVAPAEDFLPDSLVYSHLNLETTGSPAAPADSALVGALKMAAMGYLDGSDGILGRTLVTQTWVHKTRVFPAGGCPIYLPLPPLQSVTSVEYVDEAGAPRTLDPGEYSVLKGGPGKGSILPSYNNSWPSTRDIPQAVTVTFVCGYGDTADEVPAPLKVAALMAVSDMYDNRESQSVDYEIYRNPTVDALVAPYRVRF